MKEQDAFTAALQVTDPTGGLPGAGVRRRRGEVRAVA
jgi:hypothetical protein